MNETFWREKWQRNEIGFHEDQPNPLLTRHLPTLGLPEGARIFLPLCGKSLDIHWLLEQGFEVAGIELSELAVEQLFAELGLTPRISEVGVLRCYEADGLCIFVGNILDLTQAELGSVDAVYDRAALVALPENMRGPYASHLMSITNAAPALLVCLEYDQSCRPGPPFSVDDAEVRQYYDDMFHLTCIEKPKLVGGLKGVCPASEIVWIMEPRASMA
ncbi:thiopurine S-methyltransferase [Komagataeibacter sp. FNDCR2]|uniref:thiopurine S-methyltransferase n=1 Tax=Komagataeibacter sp. FNDCR2 TaxID=2878682 RepID=UPI001E37294C|nr:thiopurine S-methyltransferase [Komagataeibacter sp. FNDCR2]MCE2574254.1 thiopurine S-methyltransferase [Komagataeibacter sp. FNDCR2]